MQRQKGMGIIGLFLVIVVVGFFVLLGFKMVPAYIEYMAIKRTFVSTAQNESQNSSPATIRIALDKRFDVDNVKSLRSGDVDITKQGSKYSISAEYYVSVPLMANVSLRIDFHPTSDPK